MKSLLQTQEWVDLKVSQGWKSHEVDGIFVLEKPLPMGLSFLYAPETEYKLLQNTKIYENVKKISQNSSTIFFRLEIIDPKGAPSGRKIEDDLKKHGFIKAFEELQPEWRQIIDISKSEEEILAQMKPKGRYNIKIAQKHGVEATICPIDRLNDGIEIFYDLYEQTAQYQKLSLRDKRYFLEMMKSLYPKGEAAIIIARSNHVPLAAIIVTFYDKVASYLYGGTSRLHKEVMAPYLAHWEAMREAKKRDCVQYDLLAVAPPDAGERHKYANLTFFKEQFGGKKVNIIGSWDLVYRSFWYKMFRAAEKLRRK
jgi:lipid II:glycine glycyltransferase (peptidoglycan interpeptide bridge formation enzyme)